ncbi:hypothetical protein KAH55_04540 [bacterium]|nr:hypothetical protein [bacterium]
MQKLTVFILILCMVGGSGLLARDSFDYSQLSNSKSRVAVFSFIDKSGHHYRWWTGQSAGEGMADMLVTELVESGNFIVIERAQIAALLGEQALGQSGMVTAESAAQVGKLLGAELAIVGSITEFGYKKGKTGGRIKGFGVGVRSQEATVAVDVRIINVETSEILDAKSARSHKSSKGLSISTPKVSFGNRNDFDDSLVGKATREAIGQIQDALQAHAGSSSWSAKIIKASGGTVYINSGTVSGVQPGMIFTVFSLADELIDPDTGLSLGSEEEKVGKIKVIDSSIGDGKAAKCTVIEGTAFDRGQIVRVK